MQAEKILKRVFHYLDVEDHVLISRRGRYNEARNIAILLVRKLRIETLAEISDYFSINNFSSASSELTGLKKE